MKIIVSENALAAVQRPNNMISPANPALAPLLIHNRFLRETSLSQLSTCDPPPDLSHVESER